METQNEERHATHVEPELKEQALARLKKIEGQIRGLQRMVEDERYCGEVLVQVASVHEALRGVGKLLMRNHLSHCIAGALNSGDERDREQAYTEVLDLMYKHAR
ncbi:metal-sensitive transcriptional regulator [Longimicrobium sp.]|uniref:metal-sensitive transcriptional regulator n=1 Tax=Longimicrobium sp. TaxID=2029185 RepID=UPI002B68EC9B|nr:metal-sensitive transcriptional regulator [Longimicrobium sp.]HSU14082.1 metal-sensitive transcriptional regulator [Longimicrobium sp.]